MDGLGGIMLSIISQKRETNTVCYHLYVESQNKQINVTKQKQTQRYREQTSGYQ